MRLDSARADRIAAVVLFVLGIAMLYGGYAMDRLEIRQIHPASIPGLVPMLLGAVLAICAAMLFAGAREADEPAPENVSWANAGIALGLCLVYAVVLVGRVPFFPATAAFVAVFAGVFRWRDARETASPARVAVLSAVFGIAVSAAVSALFRYGFLVRLP